MHNRIRDLREDMDLRQVDVAQATGIDQKTLSNYETGKTNPDSATLVKLADFFNVSIDYLVGQDRNKSIVKWWYYTGNYCDTEKTWKYKVKIITKLRCSRLQRNQWDLYLKTKIRSAWADRICFIISRVQQNIWLF